MSENIFGDRLRAEMESTTPKTTQQVLADAVGVKRQSIAQYLNGSVQPPLATVVAIADYFGISIDYLTGRSETHSMDMGTQQICAMTGLTEKAYQEISKSRIKQKVINLFIEENEEGKENTLLHHAAVAHDAIVAFWKLCEEFGISEETPLDELEKRLQFRSRYIGKAERVAQRELRALANEVQKAVATIKSNEQPISKAVSSKLNRFDLPQPAHAHTFEDFQNISINIDVITGDSITIRGLDAIRKRMDKKED